MNREIDPTAPEQPAVVQTPPPIPHSPKSSSRSAAAPVKVFVTSRSPAAEYRRVLRSWAALAISLSLNLILLSTLAVMVCRGFEQPPWQALVFEFSPIIAAPPEPVAEIEIVPMPPPDEAPMLLSPVEPPADRPPSVAVPSPAVAPAPSARVNPPMPEVGKTTTLRPKFLLETTGLPTGGGLDGRNPRGRIFLTDRNGGTKASEEAVDAALQWIAAHQGEDGGWRFNLGRSDCRGKCSHRGTSNTTTGATGMALLPFLGAGHTHLSGSYQNVVLEGIRYLRRRMVVTHRGGDLQEGTMYGQGIATIALCEAYAMSGDESLREPAQLAVNFIVAAQHTAGGWRYFPNQPGDTTIFGWQMMALRSARLAGLEVPTETIQNAAGFLDSVEALDGSGYGYLNRDVARSPTAIGFLSRMYFGWHRNEQRLKLGVRRLQDWGPSTHDMYYNYYATQVMHHYGGDAWNEWNGQLRDQLIESQADKGHETGSWFFASEHAHIGGRLYTTAMCAMILEVYYRHLPLYGEDSITDQF